MEKIKKLLEQKKDLLKINEYNSNGWIIKDYIFGGQLLIREQTKEDAEYIILI